MSIEFLLSSHLSLEDASEHIDLIRGILEKTLRPPKVKLTKSITYLGEPVFRAKIDQKSRLIYKWEKIDENKEILHLIAINKKHNYKEVKRELDSVNPKKPALIKIEENLTEQPTLDIQKAATKEWAIFSNNKIIVPDEDQKKALQSLQTPAVFTGPPGAGKTTVLYSSLLLTLKKEQEIAALNADETKPAEKILFFTHSPTLLTLLEKDSKTHLGLPPILFTSWANLLLKTNPGRKLIAANAFNEWFATQKCSIANKVPEVIHYEFSLIAALGFDKYKALGERQCYYAKATQKQIELHKLLNAWFTYLDKHELIDPMVNTVPSHLVENYDRVFCDEAQNMPPVALSYLIHQTPKQGFAASLDSEQCLTLSPYIENCLLTLLHAEYGKYFAEHLPRSYRCSELVAQVGCHVIHRKHQLDGKHDRRNYKEIKSALTIDGAVSWVTKDAFKQLSDHYKDPETAVLIPDNASAKEVEQIKKFLNTDYILRYSEAIGLDLNNVILWKPFALVSAFKNLQKYGDKAIPDGLTLAQWKAFNAFYMAITRARVGVYIYEEDAFYKTLGEFIVGYLPKNKILSTKKLTTEELNEKLKQAIETHLNQNQMEIARNLMTKLGMSEQEINEKIKVAQALNNPGVQAPVAIQPVKIAEQKPCKKQTKRNQASINPPAKGNGSVAKAIPTENTASSFDGFKKILAFNNYISNLIESNNPEFLIPLFEHKNLITILFETDFVDKKNNIFYKSLFLRLLFGEIWAEKLLRLTLKKLQTSPKMREKFTHTFLCELTDTRFPPLFLLLIELELGIKILIDLFEKNPTIAMKINKEFMYGCYESCKDEMYLTAFSVLMETVLGLDLYFRIALSNYELFKQIPGKLLCEVLTFKEAGASYHRSPLLWLLFHDTVLSKLTIRRFTESNPDWVKDLTPEVLCNLCPPEAGELANTSVLYWLIKNDLNNLELIIKVNPNLLYGITAQALYTSSKNFSAFFGLITLDTMGLNILDKILALNPNLIQEITLKDLCIKVVYQCDGYFSPTITPFYWLTYAQETQCILELFLQTNPGLAKEITADILGQAFGDELAKGYGRSSLFELSSTIDGQNLLNKLFMANPSLLPSLSWEALTLQNDEEFKCTVLLNLCQYPIGLRIFADLVEQNQNLTKQFMNEVFTCKGITRLGNQCSVYSVLQSTIAGQEILKKLEPLLNPQFNGLAKVASQIGIFKSPDTKEETLFNLKGLNPFK